MSPVPLFAVFRSQAGLAGRVAGEGGPHGERAEDLLGQQPGVRQAGSALDDVRQQDIAGAAVGVPLPGREQQSGGPQPAQKVLGAGRRGQVQAGQVPPVRQPRSVAQQVVHRDLIPAGRPPGQPPADRIADRQGAPLRQQQRCRRRELLGHRRDLETRPQPAGSARARSGCAPGKGRDLPPVLLHQHHAAEPGHPRHQAMLAADPRPAQAPLAPAQARRQMPPAPAGSGKNGTRCLRKGPADETIRLSARRRPGSCPALI